MTQTPVPPRVGPATNRAASPARQRLLALFQSIRFGRVHRLVVRGGEPVLDAGTAWTRTVKVLGENGPHPASVVAEYALKREAVEFFRMLDGLGDGAIGNVEVRHGLPFSFELDETFAV